MLSQPWVRMARFSGASPQIRHPATIDFVNELTPKDELELRRLRKEEAQATRNRHANEAIRDLIRPPEPMPPKLGRPRGPSEFPDPEDLRRQIAEAVAKIRANPNRHPGGATKAAVMEQIGRGSVRTLDRALAYHGLDWMRCRDGLD